MNIFKRIKQTKIRLILFGVNLKKKFSHCLFWDCTPKFHAAMVLVSTSGSVLWDPMHWL